MATGDEILAWKKEIQEQEPVERNDCPVCGWIIDKMDDGTFHCEFCGWTYPEVRRG